MDDKLTPGARNLITDVAGLYVGNAEDHSAKTGATVLVGDAPFTAGVHVMGGAPGTRETDLLAPDKTVQQVDALVLSGGSAFGLDAASGVAEKLRAQGRGFAVGDQRVPIVPAAILFDLLNGGDKAWDRNPYALLGQMALANADTNFAIGSAGAGTGAKTADLKGGLGSASVVLPSGVTVGALVAVNSLGTVLMGEGPEFLAAPMELAAEFGGLGLGTPDPQALPRIKGLKGQNTTIAIVATDAALNKAQATRMAVAAHDGMARAIQPSHTPMDGDLVFAVSTGARPIDSAEQDGLLIGHAAAMTLSRAIARAVFAAHAEHGDTVMTWASRFGRG